MKSRVTLFLVALLVVSLLFGCSLSSGGELEALQSENEALLSTIAQLQTELAQQSAATEPLPTAAPVVYPVYGVQALLSAGGEAAETLSVAERTEITATAVIPEDSVLTGWRVNGAPLAETGDTITLTIEGPSVVEAMLRETRMIVSVNAYFQLLDEDGNAQGDKLYSLSLEGQPEQTASFLVTAEIPSGQEVDHWIINGFDCYFDSTVKSITVEQMTEAASFEVVLKATKTAMVSVTCINATFSGGGYSSASSGSVPKGTTITVTGGSEIGSPQYWLINGASYPYGKTFTYTVNSNTSFQYTGYN